MKNEELKYILRYLKYKITSYINQLRPYMSELRIKSSISQFKIDINYINFFEDYRGNTGFDIGIEKELLELRKEVYEDLLRQFINFLNKNRSDISDEVYFEIINDIKENKHIEIIDENNNLQVKIQE